MEHSVGKPFSEVPAGIDQIFVIEVARRTNQHVCKMLDAAAGLVVLDRMGIHFDCLSLSLLVCYMELHRIIVNLSMLKGEHSPVVFETPDGVWSASQWLPFHIYEWLPRFPRYAPNPFMFNHPSYFYYQIAWHSRYPVVFPHSYSYRMLRAISTNNLSEVVELLEKGFPVDHVVDPKYGYNSLQIAAMTNHFPLIELLLLRGADVDRKDRLGNTPIMIAVANQNHQAIHSLLRNGSDLNIKNNYGLTAVDKASDDPSIQKFLITFDQTKRNFPRFTIKLKLETVLRNPFWSEIKKMKIYTNKVTQHPLSRWQFDFTDYRMVSQLGKDPK